MGKMEDYRARRAAAKAARLTKLANEKAARERAAKEALADRVEVIVAALRKCGGAHPSELGATEREVKACVDAGLVVDMVNVVDGVHRRKLVLDDANALSGKV